MSVRISFPILLLSAGLSLAAAGAQAQSSFEELQPETRKAALEAVVEVEKYYYKPVSRTVLLDACVKGAANARANPDGERGDDEESDVCLRNMLKQLDGPVRYFNVSEALEMRQRKPAVATPLSSAVLEGGVLHIRIPSVDETTLPQLADALASARPGLVLDLRGNSDDHYMSSAALASPFMARGTLIATARMIKSGKSEEVRITGEHEFGARSLKLPANLPGMVLKTRMVVLVDQHTGGTAELLAAALQDHRRALIVGRQSGGKTRFRTMRSVMYGGFFALTSGEFARPSGSVIDAKGVTPDRIVAAEKDVETALALLRQ